MLKKLLVVVGAVLFLAGLVYGFAIVFVTYSDPNSSAIYDGLGRELVPAPFLVRMMLGTERMWAGIGWLIVDAVVCFGCTIGGLALMSFGFDEAV